AEAMETIETDLLDLPLLVRPIFTSMKPRPYLATLAPERLRIQDLPGRHTRRARVCATRTSNDPTRLMEDHDDVRAIRRTRRSAGQDGHLPAFPARPSEGSVSVRGRRAAAHHRRLRGRKLPEAQVGSHRADPSDAGRVPGHADRARAGRGLRPYHRAAA